MCPEWYLTIYNTAYCICGPMILKNPGFSLFHIRIRNFIKYTKYSLPYTLYLVSLLVSLIDYYQRYKAMLVEIWIRYVGWRVWFFVTLVDKMLPKESGSSSLHFFPLNKHECSTKLNRNVYGIGVCKRKFIWLKANMYSHLCMCF